MSSAKLATSLFQASFASRPAVIASAPGRVNLIGEHTDYNGGPVLPVALERRTAVAAAVAGGWRAASTLTPGVREVAIDGAMSGNWTDYLAGVVRELRALGAAPPGASIAVGSTIPVGAGLASSAALTVAVAKALSLLAGRRLGPMELADVAYRAEHDHVGVRCGRMDQTIAAHGERGTALLFDTSTGALHRIPCPMRLWIVETGVSHHLTGGELNQRRRECEDALGYCRKWHPGLSHLAQLQPADLLEVEWRLPPPLMRRVRHVVSECARTRAAARALAAGDLELLGRLLLEGHESLRQDFESTVEEADLIVSSAAELGAYGARLTGAGWGGAVVLLAPLAVEARIVAEVGETFRLRFGRAANIWSTRAGAGVRREAVSG
jgi:galactokinase